MKPASKRKKIILLIFCVILIYALWSYIMPTQYIKISAEIDENINTTQTHNSFDFRIKPDKSFFTVQQPAIFQYSSKEHGFTLPPTNLITITTDNKIEISDKAKIDSITVVPLMNLIDVDNAQPVLRNLIKIFDGAGWDRLEVLQPEKIGRLREILADKNDPDNYTQRVLVGKWKNGNHRIWLEIKEQLTQDRLEEFANILGGKAKQLKYENLYLIVVTIDKINRDE